MAANTKPVKRRAKMKTKGSVHSINVDGSGSARTGPNGNTKIVKVGRQFVAVATGKEDLSSWTDEELIQGYRKGGRYGNGGKLPNVVPIAVFQELVGRVSMRARHHFAAELQYAVDKHIQIIKAIIPDDPTAVQLKAIDMLYERVMGKPLEHVALYDGGEMPEWQKLIAQGIVGTSEDIPALNAGEVVEGEIVDGEDE